MLHQRPPLRTDQGKPLALAGTDAAQRFFEACFAEVDPEVETLFVAHLDRTAHCIHLTRHGGNVAGADFPLRSIMLDAAREGTRGLVIAHNHPSGDPSPSASDRQATRRLCLAGEAIDVAVVDHLVFGGGRWSSFRQSGLL